mgnify:CR=1 FL=1
MCRQILNCDSVEYCSYKGLTLELVLEKRNDFELNIVLIKD